MNFGRQMLLVLALPVLFVLIYGFYLAAGGNWGREAIKAQVAIRTTPHTMELRAGDGGDCRRIGEWNAETATCSLTGDSPPGTSILFMDDGLTLDGAGHSMIGLNDHVALSVIGRANVRIQNLTIRGYMEGVLLQHSTRTTLRNLRIRETTHHAIHLTGEANYNTIVDNRIGPTSPDGHGIAMWTSHGNLVAGNTIVGTRDAVRLQSAHGNTITRNFTTASMIEAIDLHIAEGNTIVFNDLMEETALPLLDDLPPGANTYTLAGGGNHYRQFSTQKQGCSDADSDGFCDEPYRFFSEGVDTKPSLQRWTTIDVASQGFVAADFTAVRPYAACTGCHLGDLLGGSEEGTVDAPDIRSILGRPIAGEEGFEYSEGLRAVGGVWTQELLHRYLASPADFAPGTTMIGITVSDADTRQQIIDHLSGMTQ